MPTCPDDGYPMVPVGQTARNEMRWGCTNAWHPRDPGPCPRCGRAGPHQAAAAGAAPDAVCRGCRHRWQPFPAPI